MAESSVAKELEICWTCSVVSSCQILASNPAYAHVVNIQQRMISFLVFSLLLFSTAFAEFIIGCARCEKNRSYLHCNNYHWSTHILVPSQFQRVWNILMSLHPKMTLVFPNWLKFLRYSIFVKKVLNALILTLDLSLFYKFGEAVSVFWSMAMHYSLVFDATSWSRTIFIGESLLHANHASCENQAKIEKLMQH